MLKRWGWGILGPLLLSGEIAIAQSPPEQSSESAIVEATLTTDNPADADGRFYALYPFEATAGETVQIELISDDFDAVLHLYNAAGQSIALNNNGGDGTNAKLVETLPADGEYTIAVQAHQPNQVGTYRLIAKPANPEDTAALARARQLDEQVAQALYETQAYAAAIPLAEESLALRQAIFGDGHFYTVLSLTYLGLLHKELRQYAQAVPILERVVTGTESELGTHISLAIALENLSTAHAAMGQHARALPFRERAVAVREALMNPNHPDLATSFSNLGWAYFSVGRYDQVEPLFKRALVIREAAFGPDHVETAQSFNNLGVLYRQLGRYEEAETLLTQTLARLEPFAEADPESFAAVLSNLAKLYEVTEREEKAESLYRRALTLRENTFGPEHLIVAKSLNNLATLYQVIGQFDAAVPLYERAIAINAQQLEADHPDQLHSIHNLANLYSRMGRFREAMTLVQKAIALREQTVGATHPLTASSLATLSLIHWSQGQLDDAIATLDQVLDIEEANLARLLAIGSERQKRAYFATMSGSHDVVVSLNQQAAPDRLAAGRLALTTILRRKGRVLDAIAENQNALQHNLTPENRRLSERLNAARAELATAIFNQPADPPQDYRDRVAELKGEIDQLEAQLARASTAFRVQQTPVEIETIQAHIPVDAVLIEFIRYRPFNSQTLERGQPHYAAYLLAATGEPQWVNLGAAAAIDSTVRTFKRRIQTVESDVESRFFPDAQALYAVLMAPVIAKLPPNTQHLLISPDSQLNLIPFGAIVHLDGRYLIEDYQITYLTSGRDLLRYAHTTPSRTQPLILADINYDAPGESAIAPVPGENRRSGELRGEFLALEHTAIEGEKIAQLLTDATLLTQNRATEGAIKAANGPEILHIATHGFFLQLEQVAAADLTSQFLLREDTLQRPPIPTQENPLLRSGLALAGFNPRQSGPEDGVLTALEVAGLNLYGTKLTVLSACETGLGEVTNGDGVYGLRRALVIAGSESQLMSLWQVDDAATQQLMVDYYQALRSGAGRSAALRQVQLDLIATENYAAPFYWAAFIPSGNWQPLRNVQEFPK